MKFQKGNKGGGRPKANHTIQAETFKKFLIEKVIAEKTPIIEALIKKGKKGDVQALKEIFDRILGKAQQNLDLTSNGKTIAAILDEIDGPTPKK